MQDDGVKNTSSKKQRRAQVLEDVTNDPIYQHKIYRRLANDNLERYHIRMEHSMDAKYRINKRNYKVGDLVKVHIAKIDCGPGDRSALPCKVAKVLDNNIYQLVCQFGILQNAFMAGEVLPLGPQEFLELEDPPMDTTITLVEAARLQSGALSGDITCTCKAKCLSMKCKCKKANIPCGSGCHAKNTGCKNRS